MPRKLYVSGINSDSFAIYLPFTSNDGCNSYRIVYVSESHSNGAIPLSDYFPLKEKVWIKYTEFVENNLTIVKQLPEDVISTDFYESYKRGIPVDLTKYIYFTNKPGIVTYFDKEYNFVINPSIKDSTNGLCRFDEWMPNDTPAIKIVVTEIINELDSYINLSNFEKNQRCKYLLTNYLNTDGTVFDIMYQILFTKSEVLVNGDIVGYVNHKEREISFKDDFLNKNMLVEKIKSLYK